MTEKLVPTKRTTPTMLDFARALLAVEPGLAKGQAGVLWAHFAGETTDGHHCWNHNLGNVKHVRGDGYDYVSLVGVWEGFKIGDEDGDGDIDADDRAMLVARLVATGLWRVDPSPDHARAVGPAKVSMVATSAHSATWFRAYPDFTAGMVAFVRGKQPDPTKPANQQPRYSGAWASVLAADCDGYARYLGARGYYTADPGAYSRAMLRKHAAWMASDAFEEAAAELRPTEPEILVYRPEPEPATVHALPDTVLRCLQCHRVSCDGSCPAAG
jgi:hypothetical protein